MKELSQREFCYKCNRPKSSCMCKYINSFQTNIKFVILMHPKEYRKTKNTTGKLTNLQLINSEIHIGIDFTYNNKINSYINNYECFILYPSQNSICLNTTSIKSNKKQLIFIIDSTWSCSKAMLKKSKNLQRLPKISFKSTKESKYSFKTQPQKYCLSTIESTKEVLSLLNKHKIENIAQEKLDSFLLPFEELVKYQVNCSLKGDLRAKNYS
ncbi:hypothetical protein CP960_00345 [Malaciobacter halophilus]|uniref:tRNA-uridine aminocarboxypropyltransferase n=1 Tax=Malaciobacter halophilus TaxID=197482 RepID=A0A2N1J6P2_9BACT|nr:tRNA-uridine aminocarboxypropyltransferase [Malaciobacter halophilus]AXH10023.1 DTW domain-containing protein [Malaciobacter halophilus]PKI82237.1 hypothetical protein CP960_00345 [Malaciobacter halophilus]